MKLAIISHTTHYFDDSGSIVGWGPTIREINFLANYFDEIYHCAPLHSNLAPKSSMPYQAKNIHFVPLEVSGGRSLKAKLSVLTKAPTNIRIINKTLKKTDVFQFRAPTGMGVYLIPWLNLFVNKQGWYKYAGNWVQQHPPMGYAFQRWLLKKVTKRKVTMNGKWPDQPAHCITFENPCLSADELTQGIQVIEEKKYQAPFNFCFVGRLETAKGVKRILDAFKLLSDKNRIGTVHLIGDGPERGDFEAFAKDIDCNIIFHGFQSRDRVAEIMKDCHFFLLPSSASEGFPKVIAEAANYGCIPIVSDVSSITQYVLNDQNGWVFQSLKIEDIAQLLDEVMGMSPDALKRFAQNANKIASDFSFENYVNRIFSDVLKKTKN